MANDTQVYRKIAAECAKSASEAKSRVERDHLLQMQDRYLNLAQKEEIDPPVPRRE
jgi:hypothetical protein